MYTTSNFENKNKAKTKTKNLKRNIFYLHIKTKHLNYITKIKAEKQLLNIYIYYTLSKAKYKRSLKINEIEIKKNILTTQKLFYSTYSHYE